MGVFGVGTGLAGVAGVIAGPTLQNHLVWLCSRFYCVCMRRCRWTWLSFGAFVASLIIGWMKTFAAAYNVGAAEILMYFGFEYPDNVYYHPWRDLWTLTLPQIDLCSLTFF